MNIDFARILVDLVPDASWSVGKTYASINWPVQDTTKPTEEECLTHWDSIKNDYILTKLRYERDLKLKDSDKYALPDFPHASPEIKQEWIDYRQSLRDITTLLLPDLDENYDLINVNWPSEPGQN